MRKFALLFLLCSAYHAATGQEAVYFFSDDGVKIRGDLYLKSNSLPFIILCHQDHSNRGEFYEVATRLLNLNYNCLAIDLRTGRNAGFTQNETAGGMPAEKRHVIPLDAMADIQAAVLYVQGLSNQPVVLLGSVSSASLCLLIAAGNPLVRAVVALSPGEYFQPRISLNREVQHITQPVFVTATASDSVYLHQLLLNIPNLTLFKPEKSNGQRGTKALAGTGEDISEYWFALMMFFKKLN